MMRKHLLSVLFTVVALQCSRREQQLHSLPPAVPIILISVDTLRSDHLPMYGYRPGLTPALDALRSDSILFDSAFSHCPQTLPSHASVMTGLLPFETGVRDNVGYSLPSGSRTLAAVLRGHGYRTGAAVSSFVLRKETGLSIGFEHYDDFMTRAPGRSGMSAERDGEASLETLTAWMHSLDTQKVFAFLHLYEPHAPYTPPDHFKNAATPYDGEISYCDSVIGTFLQDLKRRGLYDSALIVFLSDHGEGLGDHGEDEHGVFVYREAIQVPLLIKLPGQLRRGSLVSTPVGLNEIYATVLNQATASKGADLLSDETASRRPRSIYSESFYGRLHMGWKELTSLIDDRYHFIDAPRAELFEWRSDPLEKRSHTDSERRVATSMRKAIPPAAASFQPPAVTNSEDRKRLESLGYLGQAALIGGAGLPDAKDRIGSLRLYKEADSAFQSGRLKEALRKTEELVRKEPGLVNASGLLAELYKTLGRPSDALAVLKKQFEQSPANGQLALAISALLVDMKRAPEARRYAELAVTSSGVFAHEALTRIALSDNDLDSAQREAQLGLASEPDRVQMLFLFSEVRRRQNRIRDEEQLLSRALEAIEKRRLPEVGDVRFRHAEVLLQLGRVHEAENEFRLETVNFPGNLAAWANLAAIIAGQNRPQEAREVLRTALRKVPGRRTEAMTRQVLQSIGN